MKQAILKLLVKLGYKKPRKASEASWRTPYKPTKLDIEGLKIKPKTFMLSGDRVFHTLQGEGNTAGYPITFIRLHFCNLNCSWCDTYYTWKKDTQEYYREPSPIGLVELNDLIHEEQMKKGVKDFVPRIVFTGGEPMLQQMMIIEFLEMFPDYYCEIETNGTIMPNNKLIELAKSGRVKFNCSPKLTSSDNTLKARYRPDVLKTLSLIPTTIFKFVVKDNSDFKDIAHMEDNHIIAKGQISVMPEGVTKEDNAKVYEKVMPMILRHGYATHTRQQNIFFNGAKRRV